ncbi:uncharacterized protein LOC109717290 isoform X4 [Ananas comosus]|uniref:5-formyltetrahydrofolate cyclo-ligase n=1 Tax=Ananas comosus TaxID=4615 RepID=A0A6P5FQK0_ANACO|nr:uncharacterized protein LOC109717290 isoform X4 [Ananas comosus]
MLLPAASLRKLHEASFSGSREGFGICHFGAIRYYDVFLKRYQKLATENNWNQPLLDALAYSVQIMEEGVIPVTPCDVPIDALVSATGVIPISPSALEKIFTMYAKLDIKVSFCRLNIQLIANYTRSNCINYNFQFFRLDFGLLVLFVSDDLSVVL